MRSSRPGNMVPLVAQIGVTEIVLIALIVVLLFGATKIPELARSLGRAKAEFRRGSAEGGESEDDRVRSAAAALGIPTEGRSLEELRREIARKVAK
ncbi:MAG: Sec-independent protein translocase subunit TatA/TatB [Methanobacteriota archaeon]